MIGVPNAFLWGLLATVLRFVPYVGPWVAAAMPTALAFAIFDGWGTLLQVLGLFVALELISNNVVEPLMYGRRTGMSPFAVFVAVLFWTWIWGPVGLIVAIPTTLCLAVAGRYVPGLAWLHIALSGEASLDAPTRFFQRLVAMDPEAAESETIETVREGGLVSFHDELFLPALRLTEIRSQRGSLDPERRAFILRELEEIADVAEREAEPDPEALEHPSRAAIEILCIPSNGPADVTAARGLASVLHHAGFDRARVFGEEKLVGSLVDEVEALQPDLVFFVALPPGAVRRIRYRCKRLREALPRLPIGGFAWHPTREASGSPESVEESGATEGLVSFEEALDMARRVGAAVRRADARGEPLELGAE